MKVNVYDFDKTIFNGDSTQKFYLFCLKRNPKMILYLPKQLFFFIPFSLKLMPKTYFKQNFYSCFKAINNIDNEVNEFWKIQEKNIKKWYYKIQKDDDIIISASPEFLLKPICDKINIKNLIASKVNKYTGKYDGLNCYYEEKVLRLKKERPEVIINKFYSDSFSDSPLANIAKESFLVVNDDLYLWHEYKNGNKVLVYL